MAPSETLSTFFGDPAPRTPAPAGPPEPDLTPHEAALVAEACSKGGVLWLRPAGQPRAYAAWHVWHDGAVHVVFGVDEQMLPLLSGEVDVLVPSKDSGQRLVTFRAWAQALPAGAAQWQAAADALSARRLNARDPQVQHQRWAAGALITRLTPLHVLERVSGSADAPSGAAPPPGNAGTTATRRPFHLGGRSRRRRQGA